MHHTLTIPLFLSRDPGPHALAWGPVKIFWLLQCPLSPFSDFSCQGYAIAVPFHAPGAPFTQNTMNRAARRPLLCQEPALTSLGTLQFLLLLLVEGGTLLLYAESSGRVPELLLDSLVSRRIWLRS